MKKLLAIFALALCGAVSAYTVGQFSPIPGAEFTSPSGGALHKAEVFSGVSGGTAKLQRILSVDVFTNAVEIFTTTQITHTVEFSNTVTHLVFTNTYPTASGIVPSLHCVPLSSNTVEAVNATTNSWPVYKETVSQTQTIFDGTLTGNVYSNAPANVFLMQGDRLIFSGTSATNGWLRLVLE